ncbi:MAG TPA: zinc ABC transporter substrate-binding protein [Clostridiales bacterium]|nr:zinc ABC transporter substrate-binding protein [Clostridiales bacterium]
MKKLLSILMAMSVLCLVLTGCNIGNTKTESDKISIVTTVFPSYDFAKQIAGDKADVQLLLKAGEESHAYEPSVNDILAIKNSDIFICVGSMSEVWVDKVLDSIDTSKTKVIQLMDNVELLVDGEDDHDDHDDEDGHDHEDEHDHDHSEYDEHIWTSPINAITIAGVINDALIEVDTENESIYNENYNSYVEKLEDLDVKFRDIVEGAKRNTIVFGDKYPLRYFSEEYGLEYMAAFTGCSTETEPGPQTLANLINEVKEEDIPVVFYLEFSSQKIADTICEATGAKKMQFHSCHNVSSDDFNKGVTYIQLMEGNAESLKEALN